MNVDYGWVVRASKVRTGCDSIDLYMSDERPVGLSRLQQATFFTWPPDQNGQTPFQRACALAYWQLGTPVYARRVDGVIQTLE